MPGCRTSQGTDRCLVLAHMGKLWDIKLPGWLWIVVFLLAYIVIKDPAVGLWLLSLPGAPDFWDRQLLHRYQSQLRRPLS